NVRLLGSDEKEHGSAGHEGHEDESVNPHYWLSIDNGKAIARTIAEELICSIPRTRAIIGVISRLMSSN
ncbi:MAG: hypothetical protein HY801_04600, partial [Candidatus Lindowbacteria bacterium]|nr:hypothetical protein [Candidatus Lindowbacteria bacterium]